MEKHIIYKSPRFVCNLSVHLTPKKSGRNIRKGQITSDGQHIIFIWNGIQQAKLIRNLRNQHD
jgi:hypothetical protein